MAVLKVQAARHRCGDVNVYERVNTLVGGQWNGLAQGKWGSWEDRRRGREL